MHQPFTLASLAVLGLAVVPALAQERPVQPLLTLGSEAGNDGELFTNIRGVAIDQHDRIIVLDAGERRLVVFRPNGQRLQYLGRSGAGPNEFMSPMAVAIIAAGQLLVLDPQSARLTSYDTRQSDSVRYEGSWQMPLGAYAMCSAGSRLFVLADANDKLVHELSLGDRVATVIQAFAEPKSHHPIALQMRSLLIAGGQLACSPSGNRIAFAPRQLGELRVFTDKGNEVLFTRLTPFQEVVITPVERGFRFSSPSGVVQQNVALQVDDRGAASVQIVTLRSSPTTRPRADAYEMRDLTSVGATRRVSPNHSVLAAATKSRLACTRDDPFPQVLVYDRADLRTPSCP